MFETAEVGNEVSKADFKKEVPKLRVDLLEAQNTLAKSDFSLMLLIGGVEGAGKTEFANRLLEWLDARGIETHAWAEPTDEERERPPFWRFWRVLPGKGKAAFLLNSWYTSPIINRVYKKNDEAEFDRQLDRVAAFERMLAQENVLLVKLWFHLSKKEQKKRLKDLEADPDNRWRVTPRDWKFHKRYDRFRKVSERAIMKTNTSEAPWIILEATDRRYRDLAGVRCILNAIRKKAKEAAAQPKAEKTPDLPKPKPKNVLRSMDLTKKLDDKNYDKQLEKLQGRLALLARRLREESKRSLLLVFEGSDAAGKGGCIRRITQALDARNYQLRSVAAPTDEERARPYLWRFWRGLPRIGRVTIYDRSWYGRVLVERVEGFAKPEAWGRAFGEINAFEDELTEFGTIVMKFWVTISPEEQLKRFKDRQEKAYKQYKITEEDWRNRAKWNAYEAAACDMIERTNTERAPWVLVEGEDKNWARVKVLRAVVDALERELS
ncbi:MAG: polyphosphate:AMP phosphotransferase [Elusimicrobiota bacterium]